MHIVFKTECELPVKLYGGTERIIFWLIKELLAAGHQVTVIGPSSPTLSKMGAEVRDPTKAKNLSDWRLLVPPEGDIIHFFNPPSEDDLPLPFLLTIEGNGKKGEKFPCNTVFVSEGHARNHGSQRFVYNGVDFSEYPFYRGRELKAKNFLFLAKARWKVKNLKDCRTAIKRSPSKALHIAGGRIFSLSPRIRSYGMLDTAGKVRLLSFCDALLWPVRWPEPFGIAVIEAQAMGLPVIGSMFGSGRELIDQSCGVLCENRLSFFEAVKEHNPGLFRAKDIRARAQERFSSTGMCANYLMVYREIIDGGKLNDKAPEWNLDRPAQTLLDF